MFKSVKTHVSRSWKEQNMRKHEKTWENMEQSRVTWVCLQVLSASGWILACFRAHQGPTNGPCCQSSTDPHRKLSNQSRHDENFRGCESWNAQNGCNMTLHDLAWRDMIQYDMIQYDVTSVQLLVISLDNLLLSIILAFWIWHSLWWNPKIWWKNYSHVWQVSVVLLFCASNASTRDIRRKAASWVPGAGTQLETRRFARQALHATLRIPSKAKGSFQMICNKLLNFGWFKYVQRFLSVSRR